MIKSYLKDKVTIMSSFYKQEKINDSKVNIMNNLKEYSNQSGRNVIVYASNFLTSDEYLILFNEKNCCKIFVNQKGTFLSIDNTK